MDIRRLQAGEITRELFQGFNRRQVVTDCWRLVNGQWMVRSDPFVDDWSEQEYQKLAEELRSVANAGGLVAGAFADGGLKGFAAVKAGLLGTEKQYLDLIYIHVSQDMRGQGIGKALLATAKNWARVQGARKLYISAHSSVESQAFYRAMGCVEAAEYSREHVLREPYDCQLELDLFE